MVVSIKTGSQDGHRSILILVMVINFFRPPYLVIIRVGFGSCSLQVEQWAVVPDSLHLRCAAVSGLVYFYAVEEAMHLCRVHYGDIQGFAWLGRQP